MNYRSVADLNAAVLRSLPHLPHDIEVVVGIPRSGLLAASLVALHLNKPLADFQGFLEGRLLGGGNRLQSRRNKTLDPGKVRALIVDDSIQSGREIDRTRQQLSQAGLQGTFHFFCVFADAAAITKVDYHAEVCPSPRVFEWNLMHHPHLESACVDIDGVLCRDPTEEENDDGPRYENFLMNVQPLVIPGATIGWLVTCRLAKYRHLTEQWLSRHGISYRELIMMDQPDKASRKKAGSHGAFKADVYRRTGAILFVESSPEQASEILHITQRPVYCALTHTMMTGDVKATDAGSPLTPLPRLERAKGKILRLISAEDSFILVDGEELRGQLEGYRAIPFLEKDGRYWGPPADAQTAIRELKRLQQAEARYIIFVWPCFWWLDHYAQLGQYLRDHHPCMWEDEHLKIFDLKHWT